MQVRNKCVICNNNLEFLYKFRSFPVYMGVSDNININDDIMSDMIWVICKVCGCIQLKNLVDLSIIYHKGHNSAYGKTWEKHHKNLAEFVGMHCGSSILEIGGGNLKLAELLTNRYDVKFTVFDNNCEKSNNNNIITREEFFDYNNYNVDYEIDTIVNSHVLEHLYDPIEYMKMFFNMLNEGDKLIMSVPLLDEMVKAKFTNSINFEHTYMISKKLLYFIVKISGFRVIDIEIFNPYNVFIVCERTDAEDKILLNSEYDRNLIIFNDFIEFHDQFVCKVNAMEGKNFYVFGGHIFTQYLFEFGLDASKFVCVLDNDPKKIGKRLYGTEMIVKSPKILYDINNPIVVLRAAQFSEEIKKDILENINSSTIFIE